MNGPFDIFRMGPEGALWIEDSEDLDDATRRVRALVRLRPSEYLIVGEVTGQRISIKPDSVDEAISVLAS